MATSATEVAVLRYQLERVNAARSERQVEVLMLSQEVQRLERRLLELIEDDESSRELLSDVGGEEEEAEVQQPKLPPPQPHWPAPPQQPPRLQTVLPAVSVPSAKQPLNAEEVVEVVPTTVLDSSEPPCLYSSFRAGSPLVLTILNEITMIFCHWRRTSEITNLSGCNLASRPEKKLLRARYSPNVMQQHPAVNFLVWRRSVLLLLVLSSLGAFLFSLLGDNWSAFSHMQDMQLMSGFKVSYGQWREEARQHLPFISCSRIDAHFAVVLESMSRMHTVVAKSCPELLTQGVTCGDLVDKAVVGCWQPGLCQELLMDNCPSACGALTQCRDTRNAHSLDYATFTLSFIKAMLYKLIEQLSKAELQMLMFSMVSKLVACILMIQASRYWADWPRSNRFVLMAWLVTFSAPFLRSIVPTPMLLDWKPIDVHLEEYLETTDQHFDLANRMARLANVAGLTCRNHHLEEKTQHLWKTTHHKVHWWCGKVQWGAQWFPWSDMLQKGAQECQMLSNYMGIGDVATVEAREEKQKLCHMINSTHIKQEPLTGVKEVIDVAWLRSAAYSLVGTLSSFLSFRVVLPEALSVAPGLLTAALRIKVVVPQSFLPGVFIAIMPLLYVPTVWSFCIFIVQSVGDPLLLVAFTLLAFSPLAYTILGAISHVTAPMSRNGARSFATFVRRCTSFMHAAALLCLLAYGIKVALHLHYIEQSHKGVAAFILAQGQKLILPLLVGNASTLISLLFSGPLWSLIFTFWTELHLTAIVGADWMLRTSAEEWNSQGEEYFVEMEEQGRLDRAAAVSLHRQRQGAMQAMLELTAKKAAAGMGH